MKEITKPTEVNVFISTDDKLKFDKIDTSLHRYELCHIVKFLLNNGVDKKAFNLNICTPEIGDEFPDSLFTINESGSKLNFPFVEVDGQYYLLKHRNNS